MVDIRGLDKAAVLAALYNAARPQGMGFLAYKKKPMTTEEAKALLEKYSYFDYLEGRVMKIAIEGGELEERLYDRDNGNGACQLVIGYLQQTGQVSGGTIETIHESGVRAAAELAKEGMQESSGPSSYQGISTFKLGLADVKDKLEPAVNTALKDESKKQT